MRNDLENVLMTITPATIMARPASAGPSRDCRNSTQPAIEISTMPSPLQMA